MYIYSSKEFVLFEKVKEALYWRTGPLPYLPVTEFILIVSCPMCLFHSSPIIIMLSLGIDVLMKFRIKRIFIFV